MVKNSIYSRPVWTHSYKKSIQDTQRQQFSAQGEELYLQLCFWEYSPTCEDLLHSWYCIGGICITDSRQLSEGKNHARIPLSCHKNSWGGGGSLLSHFDSSSAKWSLDSQQKLHTNTWCVCCSLDIYKPNIFLCSGSVYGLAFMTCNCWWHCWRNWCCLFEVVAYPYEISFLLWQKSFSNLG